MSMNFVNEPTRAWNPKNRLREMINEGSDAANVDKLVELLIMDRSEERRVVKEWRWRGSCAH